ncbi:hypothetical protein GYMLUDRAFT_754031 [Collybiopsis luxurians FD-317 M1]|uniref:Uncharacterized protein n=1 Tax=Collybiopsis luxurians FD-317 M1 TaxID=944289 RepID=A0A0D0CHA9_9AGAR|nr:hypothetical protein GYMLUDRAFT_754031 [Collybiopsis luxurians FD-317 M1]
MLRWCSSKRNIIISSIPLESPYAPPLHCRFSINASMSTIAGTGTSSQANAHHTKTFRALFRRREACSAMISRFSLDSQSWAVVDSGSGGEKIIVLDNLLGRYRLSPILLFQADFSPFSISEAPTHSQRSQSSPSDTGNNPEGNCRTIQPEIHTAFRMPYETWTKTLNLHL